MNELLEQGSTSKQVYKKKEEVILQACSLQEGHYRI